MARTPVFMNAFDRIVNVSEVLKVREVPEQQALGQPQYIRVDFIEQGYMELPGVTKDEFWEALTNASLTLQENRRTSGSKDSQ